MIGSLKDLVGGKCDISVSSVLDAVVYTLEEDVDWLCGSFI
jgi:hypothetical protein